jgi:hypothetical protein
MARLEQQEVEELVDKGVESITITSEGLAKSRERAGEFLVIQAVLTTYLKQVSEDLSKLSALKDATFADSIRKSEGKNVTEKKINVAKDDGYTGALKNYEELDSLRDWVKGHIKIFENAHILYRGLSRSE